MTGPCDKCGETHKGTHDLALLECIDVLVRQRDDALEDLERLRGRRFKVMDAGISVPWAMVAAHEPQAIKNHDQTLERLNERGGLDPTELLAVLDGVRWREVFGKMTAVEARAEVLRRAAAFEEASK